MKKILLLLVVAISLGSVFAEDYPFDGHNTINDKMQGKCKILLRQESVDGVNDDAEESFVSRSFTLTNAGELPDLLGDDKYEINEIKVIGDINEEDIKAIWDLAYNGELKNIDLGQAAIENGVIPEHAFFHSDEQVDWDTLIIYVTGIEKVILPYNTVEIGRLAFGYSIHLAEIQCPQTLKIIGEAAFTDCISLTTDNLPLPNGLEIIDYQAFMNCKGLDGEVVLPSSVKRLNGGAFYYSTLTKIYLPDGLEYLGMFAFNHSNLTEAYVPDNCSLGVEGYQFNGNYYLQSVHLPDNTQYLPEAICQNCIELRKVVVPSNVKSLGILAFSGCLKLEEVTIPEGVKLLAENAFGFCESLKELVLPSTITNIGIGCFHCCDGVTKVVCKAITPPTCEGDETTSHLAVPFVGIPTNTPVYIPRGTKESYQLAFGWRYFKNFIEVDTFPDSSVEAVWADEKQSDDAVYDLNGRKVANPTPGRIYISNGEKFLQQ